MNKFANLANLTGGKRSQSEVKTSDELGLTKQLIGDRVARSRRLITFENGAGKVRNEVSACRLAKNKRKVARRVDFSPPIIV